MPILRSAPTSASRLPPRSKDWRDRRRRDRRCAGHVRQQLEAAAATARCGCRRARRTGTTTPLPCAAPAPSSRLRRGSGVKRWMFRPQTCSTAAVESELRERNPQLGGPPLLVDAACAHPTPDRTPRRRSPRCPRDESDRCARRGRHAEDVGGAPVVKRVERDEDVLGLLDPIAPAHRCLDARPGLLVHSRADIERGRSRTRTGSPSSRWAAHLRRAPSERSRRSPGTCSQTESSSRPSRRIAPSATRVACARLDGALVS